MPRSRKKTGSGVCLYYWGDGEWSSQPISNPSPSALTDLGNELEPAQQMVGQPGLAAINVAGATEQTDVRNAGIEPGPGDDDYDDDNRFTAGDGAPEAHDALGSFGTRVLSTDHTMCVFTPNERETHYLVAYETTASNNRKKYCFAFVGFRFVGFQDKKVLVSFCKNCPACKDASAANLHVQMFEGTDYPQSTSTTFLEPGFTPLCPLARLLFDKLHFASEPMLLEFISVAYQHRGSDDPPTTTPLPPGRVVVSPQPGFLHWGVVREESGCRDMMCMTCERNNRRCKHVHALRGASADVEATREARLAGMKEQFEKSFRDRFDVDAGQRKLKGLSRYEARQHIQAQPTSYATASIAN